MQKHDIEKSIPVTWDKLKVFFHRSLNNSQAFVDSYWGKIKRNSQYQLEKILD